MKYLKLFENFNTLILYHGTPYDFKEFKNRLTFFSSNPKFARDYSDTKSQDSEMDADTRIAECEFKGNLFRYNDEPAMKKLSEILPDKIKVSHGTMWFMDKEFDKAEVIKRLQAVATINPIDYIANANIGDLVDDPSYKIDKMMVVDKNEDTIYTIHKKTYDSYLSSSSLGYDKHWSYYAKYKDIFESWRQAIVDTYNKNAGTNYPLPKHGSFENFYHTFNYARSGYNIDYVSRHNNEKVKFLKEDIENVDAIYDKCLKEFEALAKKELDKKEWNRKTIDEPMESNWTYYETKEVTDAIIELGYDAYVALENKHKTYGVFEPNKTIKIIEIY